MQRYKYFFNQQKNILNKLQIDSFSTEENGKYCVAVNGNVFALLEVFDTYTAIFGNHGNSEGVVASGSDIEVEVSTLREIHFGYLFETDIFGSTFDGGEHRRCRVVDSKASGEEVDRVVGGDGDRHDFFGGFDVETHNAAKGFEGEVGTAVLGLGIEGHAFGEGNSILYSRNHDAAFSTPERSGIDKMAHTVGGHGVGKLEGGMTAVGDKSGKGNLVGSKSLIPGNEEVAHIPSDRSIAVAGHFLDGYLVHTVVVARNKCHKHSG